MNKKKFTKVEEAKKYFEDKINKLTKEPELNNPSKKEIQKKAAAALAEAMFERFEKKNPEFKDFGKKPITIDNVSVIPKKETKDMTAKEIDDEIDAGVEEVKKNDTISKRK